MIGSIYRWIFIVLALFLLACGGGEGGTGVANPPSKVAGAAVAAVTVVFSVEEANESLGAFMMMQNSGNDCSDDPDCICMDVTSENPPPEAVPDDLPIDLYSFSDPGTYGSFQFSVTVDEEDFCTLPNGAVNSGSGPDGLGRFAAFEFTSDVTESCIDSDGVQTSPAIKAGSSGIWRITSATGTDPAYVPQIFGTFIFELEGRQSVANCTIYMSEEDDEALFSDCSDQNNNTLELDSGAICSF